MTMTAMRNSKIFSPRTVLVGLMGFFLGVIDPPFGFTLRKSAVVRLESPVNIAVSRWTRLPLGWFPP
jgi:hypothetical protein